MMDSGRASKIMDSNNNYLNDYDQMEDLIMAKTVVLPMQDQPEIKIESLHSEKDVIMRHTGIDQACKQLEFGQ